MIAYLSLEQGSESSAAIDVVESFLHNDAQLYDLSASADGAWYTYGKYPSHVGVPFQLERVP